MKTQYGVYYVYTGDGREVITLAKNIEDAHRQADILKGAKRADGKSPLYTGVKVVRREVSPWHD